VENFGWVELYWPINGNNKQEQQQENESWFLWLAVRFRNDEGKEH